MYIKVKLNRSVGEISKGSIVDAELKKHGVIVIDNSGIPRLLDNGEYSLHSVNGKITLRRAREMACKRSDDVAKDIQRSQSTVLTYERGEKEVPASLRIVLADSIGFNVKDLDFNLENNAKSLQSTRTDAERKKIERATYTSLSKTVDELEVRIEKVYSELDKLANSTGHDSLLLLKEVEALNKDSDINGSIIHKLDSELHTFKNLTFFQRMKYLFAGKL